MASSSRRSTLSFENTASTCSSASFDSIEDPCDGLLFASTLSRSISMRVKIIEGNEEEASNFPQELLLLKRRSTLSCVEVANSTNNNYKTALCHNYTAHGHCEYGIRCSFAHGENQLLSKAADGQNNNQLFKTKPCKNFHEQSYCPYGSRCNFVHEVKSIHAILARRRYQKKLIQTISKCNEGVIPAVHNNIAPRGRLPIFNYICSQKKALFVEKHSQ